MSKNYVEILNKAVDSGKKALNNWENIDNVISNLKKNKRLKNKCELILIFDNKIQKTGFKVKYKNTVSGEYDIINASVFVKIDNMIIERNVNEKTKNRLINLLIHKSKIDKNFK